MTMNRASAKFIVPISLVVAVVTTILVLAGDGDTPPAPAETSASADEAQGTWICPMHPQIRQQEPGDCPICGMDLVLVEEEAEGADAGERRLTVSEAAKRLMDISTSPVERRHVEVEVSLVGKVAYDEGRVSKITAWVPGRLERLHVDYTGQIVEKGDPMVDLYGPQLLAAQEELVQSSAAVARAREGGSERAQAAAASTLDAVRERLRLWGISEDQIREMGERDTPESHVTIHAPRGGTVVEMNAVEGTYVSTGTVIYTIADLTEVWVELDAYESDLAWIRVGQVVDMRVEAYQGEVFHGKVAFIEPIVDPKTRTVDVRVEAANPDGRLMPDMFVRAVVRAMPHAHGADAPLVIPATAPLITGKRAVVYVEVEGTDRPTFEGREVVLGARAGDYYVVHSGLVEGERVVTEGNFKIDSALQIRAKPSMMSPEGGEKPPAHEHGGHTQ